MTLDPTWLALIGALFGGAGLKVIDHQINKKRLKTDDAARIREELRMEITSQKEEIAKLESDRDKWRADYYDLRDQFSKLQTELTIAIQHLKNSE